MMNIVSSAMIPKGIKALFMEGKVVWLGPLNSKIEVDCDAIYLSPDDYEELKVMLDEISK